MNRPYDLLTEHKKGGFHIYSFFVNYKSTIYGSLLYRDDKLYEVSADIFTDEFSFLENSDKIVDFTDTRKDFKSTITRDNVGNKTIDEIFEESVKTFKKLSTENRGIIDVVPLTYK